MRSLRLLFILICVFFFEACNHSKADSQTSDILLSQLPAEIKLTTTNKYSWQTNYDIKNAIVNRIAVPKGFKRVEAIEGTFADWLRYLMLKPGNPDVHLYNGELKGYQSGHAAVLDIDVGNTDIQQCADAVIRMRAEYLYSIKEYENLHFNFTSGNTIGFQKWSEGYRTVIKGNSVTWTKSATKDDSYKTFKSYINTIFNYAGTSSLSKELKKVSDIKWIQIGDVFILGGFPGHAVLVIDVCENPDTKEKLFMIQQSYMPAQEIHILKNFTNAGISPWYSVNFDGDLKTPEWTFSKDQLMRW
ncbi:MAG: DUF4846 domain-containing protein [Bacteroidetes bacterium]|nr:DUF4846 domain-containing protein [Bacteroidota bacterium]